MNTASNLNIGGYFAYKAVNVKKTMKLPVWGVGVFDVNDCNIDVFKIIFKTKLS